MSTHIEKVHCVTHVHKRMGKGLRTLCKTSSNCQRGTWGLTDGLMTSLTDYYRSAIMNNRTKNKSPEDISNAVKKVCSCITEGYKKQHKPSCKLIKPWAMLNMNYVKIWRNSYCKTWRQWAMRRLCAKTLITDGDLHPQLGMHSEMEKRGNRVEKGRVSNVLLELVKLAEWVQNQGKLATFIERRSANEFRAIQRKYAGHEDHLEQLIEARHLAKIGCIQVHKRLLRVDHIVTKNDCKASFMCHA